MPTYQSPRHGVSLSDALAEAAAVAPIDRVVHSTFELWHPLLPDGPIYLVSDHEALLATIESTADRNAGVEVEFLAAPVRISRPEESDAAATPEIQLEADNVSGALSDALKITRGSLEPWVLIERIYASDDTSAPAVMPPMQMQLTNAEIAGAVARIRASFGDPVNVSVPRITFQRAAYPGLSAR